MCLGMFLNSSRDIYIRPYMLFNLIVWYRQQCVCKESGCMHTCIYLLKKTLFENCKIKVNGIQAYCQTQGHMFAAFKLIAKYKEWIVLHKPVAMRDHMLESPRVQEPDVVLICGRVRNLWKFRDLPCLSRYTHSTHTSWLLYWSILWHYIASCSNRAEFYSIEMHPQIMWCFALYFISYKYIQYAMHSFLSRI